VNSDMMIAYGTFIPRAVGLIRSMLSFEKSIVKDSKDIGTEAEDNFFVKMDESFAGVEVLSQEAFHERLAQSNVINDREIQAVKHLLYPFGEEVPVEEAKSQIWSLIKNMRRHKGP